MNIARSGFKSVLDGWKIPHTVGGIKYSKCHPNSLCAPKINRVLKCSFVYDDVDSKTGKPFTAIGQQVELYVKNLFGWKTHVGSSVTTLQGECSFFYDWRDPFFSKKHQLYIELKKDTFPSTHQGLFGTVKKVTEQTIELTADKNSFSIETEPLLLSYANQSKDLTQVQVPPQSQRQSLKYILAMGKAGTPEILKSLFVTAFQNYLSGSQVQAIYDAFGKQYPKIELTPENLLFALQNEICAVGAIKTESGYMWEASWDGCEFDRAHSLPNVEVHTVLNAENLLELTRIQIKYREDKQAQTVTPKDTEQLKRAIYIAMSVFGLSGEARSHLAAGHIKPGIVAPSFFKYISKENPLFKYLAIHFQGIQSINYAGSLGIIFGKNSSLEASALTADAIADIIIKAAKAKANWKEYKPAEPISSTDYFAAAEKKHFEILLKHYRKYIDTHRDGIRQHWQDIYRWSEAIHAHLAEIPKITVVSENPSGKDFEDLAKFLAWIITKVTFIHWAMHSRQHLFANIHTLSAATGDRCLDKHGNFAPVGNTSAADANKQLLVTRTLLNYNGDCLIDNEYQDIDPELVQELRNNFIEYKGYTDIRKMYPNVPI